MSDLGNKEIFAKNLKHYMDAYSKDRNDICQILDVPYSTLSDWLNAKKYPRIDKIELLANYFNIQKSDLIESKEENKFGQETEQLKQFRLLFDKVKDLPEESQRMIYNVTKSVMDEIDAQLDNKDL